MSKVRLTEFDHNFDRDTVRSFKSIFIHHDVRHFSYVDMLEMITLSYLKTNTNSHSCIKISFKIIKYRVENIKNILTNKEYNWDEFILTMKDLDGCLFDYHPRIIIAESVKEVEPVGNGNYGIVYGYHLTDKMAHIQSYIAKEFKKIISTEREDIKREIAKEIIFSQWLGCHTCKSFFIESYGCYLNDAFPVLYFKKMDGDTKKLLCEKTDTNFTIKKDIDPDLIQKFNSFIVKAVKRLHHYGIAHRDIKFENILYECEGVNYKFVLSDFGLSQCLRLKDQNYTPDGRRCVVTEKNCVPYQPMGTLYFSPKQKIFKTEKIKIADYYAVCLIVLARHGSGLANVLKIPGEERSEIESNIKKMPTDLFNELEAEAHKILCLIIDSVNDENIPQIKKLYNGMVELAQKMIF